jgi:acetyl esterase/lipase
MHRRLSEYKKAEALEPENSSFVLNLGLAYYKSGRIADAAQEFSKAHELARAGDFPCRVLRVGLKYRVPRRPDEIKGEPARRPLQDAQRAVSLVRSRSKEWGIDPKKIGMIGFSAGGHLAIATATNFEQRSYEPIDDVDKISCRPDFAIPVYSGYLKAKDKDELAPGLRVPAGTPPVFLAHGSDDIVSPPEHSVVMYLALKKAGIPTELHIYANTTHDFGVRQSDRPYATWTASCAHWLRNQGLLQPPMQP